MDSEKTVTDEKWAEVLHGLQYIWNNQFQEAEAIFARKKDTDPRYSLHYAEIAFLRSFITADVNDTASSVERLRQTKDLCLNQLKFYEKGLVPLEVQNVDPHNRVAVVNAFFNVRLVYGDCLYMSATLKMTRGSKLKGILMLRKSWKTFEYTMEHFRQLEHYDPELISCLNFGTGFFYFAMSIIPSNFLKLAQFVGFKADRALGLRYMRECHERGGIRSAFATIVLLFNNLLLPRGLADPSEALIEADGLIKQSLIRFPHGSLFQVMASHCARKQCKVNEGMEHIVQALENCRSLAKPPLMFVYEKACIHCMLLEWNKAIELFNQLVEESNFQVRAICCLQLACAYLMVGQRDQAFESFKKVSTVTQKSSGVDHYAVSNAQRYLNNGGWFSAFEILYLRRDLAKMDSYLVQALALLESQAQQAGALTPVQHPSKTQAGQATPKRFSLNSLKSSISSLGGPTQSVNYTVENRAAYLLLKGAMLKYRRGLGNPEAIECLHEILEMQGSISEKYYVAYSYYELCESHFFNGDVETARTMCKKCASVKDFTWEDPLKVRLRVTQDQLKKGPVHGEVMMQQRSESPAIVSLAATPTQTSSSTTTVEQQTPAADEEDLFDAL